MSGITSQMSVSASAMNAHAWGMAVTAHNVANVSTPGFTPQRAVYADGPDGRGVQLDAVLQDSGPTGVPATATPDTPNAAASAAGFVNPSGTDLGREMTHMISTQRGYEANAQAIRTSDAMLGTLLDMTA